MTAETTFNAATWIAANTERGTHVSAEAQEAVATFTTMWNFFESTLCANRASLAAFDRLLERYDANRVNPETAQAIQDCLAFWRFRYRTPDGVSQRFLGLNFRPNDRQRHVEQVLSAARTDLKDELLALMIIVYRLRNNLFHGLKTLDMLNDQVQNLTVASKCLAALLEAIPSPLVVPRANAARRPRA